jgi:hypothetical protein
MAKVDTGVKRKTNVNRKKAKLDIDGTTATMETSRKNHKPESRRTAKLDSKKGKLDTSLLNGKDFVRSCFILQVSSAL